MSLTTLFLLLLVRNLTAKDLWKGSPCEANSLPGVCISYYDCPSAIKLVQNGLKPVHCVFEGSTPIVCCPKRGRDVGVTAEGKCGEYTRKFVEHKFPPRIHGFVGGVDAMNAEFPHMAALGYEYRGDVQWICGGSLISEDFVLTAAHCLNSKVGTVKYVHLGDVNLDGSSGTQQEYQVTRRIPHPDYSPPSIYNDIGLLKLDRPVQFSRTIKPACLHLESSISKLTVKGVGWGLTEFGGLPSNTLQTGVLQVFSHEECSQVFANNNRRLSKGILDETQICAGGRDVERDTCQGDSGGPLQVTFRSRLAQIVGVTSFGKSCGVRNVPGVYTRVSNYVKWIEDTVWP